MPLHLFKIKDQTKRKFYQPLKHREQPAPLRKIGGIISFPPYKDLPVSIDYG